MNPSGPRPSNATLPTPPEAGRPDKTTMGWDLIGWHEDGHGQGHGCSFGMMTIILAVAPPSIMHSVVVYFVV